MNNILISAYAISPNRGSECAVGWEFIKGLSKYFRVHVFFCSRTPAGDNYFNEILEYLDNNPIPNLVLCPIEMPRISRVWTFFHDIGLWPFYYLGYNSWQRAVYRNVKVYICDHPIDLIYQLNMIGYREPGYLWKLDKPFIWGPINGFHSIPPKFIIKMPKKVGFLQFLKFTMNEIQKNVAFRPRKIARIAQLVYCVDNLAFQTISKWGGKAKLLQETGLHKISGINRISDLNNSSEVRIVWSGMISPGKALDILLNAICKLKNTRIKLTVIGDGSQKAFLEKKFLNKGMDIHWTGWLSKIEAHKSLQNQDLLVHTSLKEGTPHVILEALGNCIPVICHDTCGMSAVVNANNGFKLDYIDYDSSVNQLIEVLNNILNNADLINSRKRYLEDNRDSLTWESKILTVANDINQILLKNEKS